MNLGLDAAKFRAPGQVRFAVTLRNPSPKDLQNLSVWLQLPPSTDLKKVADKINVKAGKTTVVSFDHVFAGPGSYEVQVVVQNAEGSPSAAIRIRVRAPNEPGGAGVRLDQGGPAVATVAVPRTPQEPATAAAPPPPVVPATAAVPEKPQPPELVPVAPPVSVTGPITGVEGLTMTLPFQPSPAQPGQVQLQLQVNVPDSKAPSQVKFTVNIQDIGDTDLSNLGVWFRPFEGGPWANVATNVTLRSKEQANVSFDYAFAQPGTYAPLVVIQGVEGTPTATIQIEVPGAAQTNGPPGNSGSKGKDKGKDKGK